MTNKYILPTVLVLVGLGVGFVGGYFFKNYEQTQQRNSLKAGGTGGQRFVPNGTGGQGGQNRGMFGGGVEGEVFLVDDKSLTIKLTDGSTKIVLFSGATTYSATSISKKEDLKEGTKVAVFGTSNSDGSITAQSVQINPITKWASSPSPSLN